MKTLFILFAPLFLFSQGLEYPDTVVTTNGKSFPCRITQLTDSVIKLTYGKNSTVSIGLNGVKRIWLDTLGPVYTSQSGFTADRKKIDDHILKREIAPATAEGIPPEGTVASPEMERDTFPRFSFGAFYTPYSRSYKIGYTDYNNNIRITQIEDNLSKMEAQFSYFFSRQIALSMELGYNTSFSKRRFEQYGQDIYDTTHTGSIDTRDLKQFIVMLSVKYYFYKPSLKKVNPFIMLGVGRQFATFRDDSESLFPKNPPDYVSSDNFNEYMSDLNSPYMVTGAFGVEYYLSPSLSLFSAVRFSYMYAAADYRYEIDYNDSYERIFRRKGKSELSSSLTSVGIGLNFYF